MPFEILYDGFVRRFSVLLPPDWMTVIEQTSPLMMMVFVGDGPIATTTIGGAQVPGLSAVGAGAVRTRRPGPLHAAKQANSLRRLDWSVIQGDVIKSAAVDWASEHGIGNVPVLRVPTADLEDANSLMLSYDTDGMMPSVVHIGPDMRILSVDEGLLDPSTFLE